MTELLLAAPPRAIYNSSQFHSGRRMMKRNQKPGWMPNVHERRHEWTWKSSLNDREKPWGTCTTANANARFRLGEIDKRNVTERTQFFTPMLVRVRLLKSLFTTDHSFSDGVVHYGIISGTKKSWDTTFWWYEEMSSLVKELSEKYAWSHETVCSTNRIPFHRTRLNISDNYSAITIIKIGGTYYANYGRITYKPVARKWCRHCSQTRASRTDQSRARENSRIDQSRARQNSRTDQSRARQNSRTDQSRASRNSRTDQSRPQTDDSLPAQTRDGGGRNRPIALLVAWLISLHS